jgi:hypothetical protein
MKLTDSAIDMHVNHFDANDPVSGLPISDETPFISLSAGTVERDSVAKTNNVHRARRTALWFGTQFGRRSTAYLYTCWLLLAPRPAVGVEGVAEEVRDLNAYRRYSPYQTEGEIVAKVIVPDNHILARTFHPVCLWSGFGYVGKPSWAGTMRIVEIRKSDTGGPP